MQEDTSFAQNWCGSNVCFLTFYAEKPLCSSYAKYRRPPALDSCLLANQWFFPHSKRVAPVTACFPGACGEGASPFEALLYVSWPGMR